MGEGIDLADVHQLQILLLIAHESALVAVLQIEVDDAETLGHLTKEWEHMGPHDMDAAEGELSKVGGIEAGIRTAHLARFYVRPAIEDHLVVEEQVTLRLTAADNQEGIGGRRDVGELGKVEIAQDVDIMDEDGALGIE